MARQMKSTTDTRGQRRTASVLIKLRPLERAAIEQLAEQDQMPLSSVARRAILKDLRERQLRTATDE